MHTHRVESLVERARSGDRDAAGVLVRLHQGAVYAVALARLRDPDDAREAAQEAFLRVLGRLDRLRDARRFGAYVVRTVGRVASDLRRRRRPGPLPELADPAPGPEDRLHGLDRGRRLEEELDRLPEELRRVFLLRHAEGASYARIAALLEMPEGTVAWTLHRARRSLASSLRDLEEEER